MLLTAITSANFDWTVKPNKLTINFDADVHTYFTANSFNIDRTSTATDAAMTDPTISFSGDGKTAYVTYPSYQRPNSTLTGVYSDGYFRFTATPDGLLGLAQPYKYDFFYLAGDADHSGRVDGNDYHQIDVGFNQQYTGWVNGDFNYSGAVTFDDYAIIDTAYGATLTAPSSDPGAFSVSYLPSDGKVWSTWALPAGVGDESQIEGFRVQRSLDGTSFTDYWNLPRTARSFGDGSLGEGVKAWYRVRAWSTQGSEYTVNTGYTPKKSAITPLPAPTLDAANFNPRGVEADIAFIDNSLAETSFVIEVSGGDLEEPLTFNAPAHDGTGATSFTVDSLTPYTTYSVRLKSRNGVTDSVQRPAQPVDTGGVMPTSTWTTIWWYGAPVGADAGNPNNVTFPDHDWYSSDAMDNRVDTFTFNNLPRHTFARITAHFSPIADYGNPPDPLKQVTLRVRGLQARQWHAGDPSDLSAYGAWSWGGDNVYGDPNDSGVIRGDIREDSISVEVTGEGFGDTSYGSWSLDYLKVSTYFPFVDVTGGGAVMESGTGTGHISLVRTSGSLAVLADPLPVKLNVSGSATSGQDYTSIDATIPAWQESVELLHPVSDSTPEWTEDLTVAAAPDSKRYAIYTVAGQKSVVTAEIVDDDLHIGSLPDTLVVNNDDDDDDNVSDMEQEGAVSGEDDLYELTIDVPRDPKPGAKVLLTAPNDKVHVFEHADRGGTAYINASRNVYTWIYGTNDPPQDGKVYVEAVGGSESVNDVTFLLWATDLDAAPPPRIAATTTSASTSTTAYGIVINFHGVDVTNKRASSVLIGSKIDPQMQVLGPWTPNADDYLWTVPGPTFKDYTIGEQGIVTPLSPADLTKSSTKFYWSDGDFDGIDQEVYCAVKVKPGLIEQRRTTFKVFKPDAQASSDIGHMRYAPHSIHGEVFGLYDAVGPDTEGINFVSHVTMPEPFTASMPNIGFAQVLTTFYDGIIVDDADGTYQEWTEPTAYPILDTVFPYNGWTQVNPFDGEATIVTYDNPHQPLENLKWVGFDFGADMYLMFEPAEADSRPVPLMKLTWWCGGEINKVGADWIPEHTYAGKSDWTDIVDLPQWNGTFGGAFE